MRLIRNILLAISFRLFCAAKKADQLLALSKDDKKHEYD